MEKSPSRSPDGPRRASPLQLLLVLPALLAAIAATGCASTAGLKPQRSYIPEQTPPPVVDAAAEDENVGLVVETVISPGGGGSWFKDAPWEEYVVTLRNQGEEPVRVQGFELVDQRGVYVEAEGRMELLAEQTETLVAEYKKLGIAGAAAGVAVQGLGLAGAGFLGASAAAAAPVAVLAAPAYLLWRRHEVKEDQERVEEEFAERLLPARVSLAPGGSIRGSVFFPLVAGPQRLVVAYAAGNQRRELELDLASMEARGR